MDFNKIKFPHTHDLKNLINLLNENNLNPLGDITAILLLTQYAVEGRYSVIHDDLDDTEKYIIILDDLLAVVIDSLNKVA